MLEVIDGCFLGMSDCKEIRAFDEDYSIACPLKRNDPTLILVMYEGEDGQRNNEGGIVKRVRRGAAYKW